jgi:hypothetical protein
MSCIYTQISSIIDVGLCKGVCVQGGFITVGYTIGNWGDGLGRDIMIFTQM